MYLSHSILSEFPFFLIAIFIHSQDLVDIVKIDAKELAAAYRNVAERHIDVAEKGEETSMEAWEKLNERNSSRP